MCNSDGRGRRPVPAWTASVIAEAFFDVHITEEAQARDDFLPDHDNVLLTHILEYISENPECININWDVISNQWNVSTRVGFSAWVMEFRFNLLKQMYDA